MTDEELANLSDEALINKIDTAGLAERLASQDEWKLVAEAWRRTSEIAEKALVKIDASQVHQVVELQQIAKLYDRGILGVINYHRQVGKIAFEEAKGRGLMDRLTALFTR